MAWTPDNDERNRSRNMVVLPKILIVDFLIAQCENLVAQVVRKNSTNRYAQASSKAILCYTVLSRSRMLNVQHTVARAYRVRYWRTIFYGKIGSIFALPLCHKSCM